MAASTQNPALAALLFLYREVLGQDLPWLDGVTRAACTRRLPVVLTPSEVRALMLHLNGVMHLLTALLYGTGMRVLEGLRWRVKDIEFERRKIVVRSGKGDKDRITALPETVIPALRQQPQRSRNDPSQLDAVINTACRKPRTSMDAPSKVNSFFGFLLLPERLSVTDDGRVRSGR